MELRAYETRAWRLWQKSAAGDGRHRSRRCGRCGAQRLPRSDRRICQRGISDGGRGDTVKEMPGKHQVGHCCSVAPPFDKTFENLAGHVKNVTCSFKDLSPRVQDLEGRATTRL